MSVPSPPVKLVQGGCSVIWNDTLYALQPGAFQSLSLKPGAKWQKLSLGVDVMFPSCVVGNQGGQPMMFVVGGRASNKDYGGLQRYGFKDKQWHTMKFNAQSILSNRISHGTSWLNDTQNILVYAGYQDDSGNPSQQTFTVSTGEPPVVQSYNGGSPPPVMSPTMTPWDNSHALMAGGSETNQQVWTFGIAEGWKQVKVTLPKGTPSMMGLQASLIQGSNGSRILEVYDMSKVPCSVTDLMLATGAEKNNKRAVDKQVEPADKPVYNETWAPQTTLQGYTLAQSSDGLVVMVGGHSDPKADSIAIFNQTGNTWVNGGNFFSGKKVEVDTPASSTTSSLSSTPTSSPTISSSPAPSGPMNQSDFTRMILAAVLGSIFGAIALAIIFLLLLRCLRRRSDKKEEEQRMAEKLGRQGTFRGPAGGPGYDQQFGGFSQRELTSPVDRTPTPDAALALATCPVHGGSTQPQYQYQQSAQPQQRAARQDMGWSQYFSSDSHKEVGTRPNHNDTSDTARLTAYTEQSDYTSDAHTSAEVAPLDLHPVPLPDHDRDTFYNSTASQPDGWDPTASSSNGSMPRAPSSVYEGDGGRYSTATGARRSGPHPGDRVVIPSFPGVPASRTASIVEPNGDSDRGMRYTASRDLENIPESHGLSSNPPPPRRRSSKYVDDMSWLNLQRK